MKKSKRTERLVFILKVLNEEEYGVTISDLHKKITKNYQIKISRKTIERDIADIVKKGFFLLDSKHPLTVYSAGIRDCLIYLSNEDITYLLIVLPDGNPLKKKLKTFMGLDIFCHTHDE